MAIDRITPDHNHARQERTGEAGRRERAEVAATGARAGTEESGSTESAAPAPSMCWLCAAPAPAQWVARARAPWRNPWHRESAPTRIRH